MCGRARCTLAREEVAEAAGVAPDEFVDGNKYNPVENMGPGRYGPILLQCGGAKVEGEAKMKTRLQAMRWGLVPSFTKANAKPDHFLMFNARSENLRERPAFKRLLESKRCVVLCEGYYEWQQVDKREKQPYYFYREGVPMKVILSDEGVDRWLSGAKFEDLKDLLASYRSADLKWHPVDRKVGSMQFQSEDCAKKVNIKHAGDIKAFFGVKTEKQEPKISSPATSGSQIKPEEETCSDTAAASPPSKKEEHDSNADTTPKKEFEQFPTKFVPASALLNKHSDDEYQDSPPSKSPSKRRRLSSPTKSKSPAKKSKQPGPKQSSLDFFFGKGSK
ncbi:Embryonic stem cell-specific 5-hydroxymethylcytosine-binding protein [Phytophthora nicotianae]|uniref:Embryonic stem cell-specific 5-hydroxymethylcytosine-binding protein n=1 Tax=Phytophthora nicotianae TaxID=4792 RepID=A0A0W8D8S7_PHYNI|nr:Embryonic stem cell-specific 5-hydroxymethylcytosine-binding protein [Phytophthora nicotianae]